MMNSSALGGVPDWNRMWQENRIHTLDTAPQWADNGWQLGVVTMFTGINLPSISVSKSIEPTPLDLLLACHERIRHFSAVARRIAESANAPLDQIADAAADVHRYFTVALPLHEADETVSVEPRLSAAVPGCAAALASEQMLVQHKEINMLLRQLLALWDALCREPEELPAFSPRLLELSAQFEKLWDAHLKLEEETVFPAINQLSAPDQDEILREMRERRQGQEYAA
jgi:hemerythrin-like domain-containing protein